MKLRPALEQLRKSADGVIVAASRLNDESLAAAAAKMPMVTVNRDVGGVPAVIIDTPSAMPQTLDHLISTGAHIRGLRSRASSLAVKRAALGRAFRSRRGPWGGRS